MNGVLGGEVAAGSVWSQSPFGISYVIGSTAYDRNAKVLGTVPWDARQTATWSSDGRFLCAAVPDRATTGAQMRLETAVIGQPAKIIASGRKPATAHQVHRTARTALGEALRRGHIVRNPAALAKAPAEEPFPIPIIQMDGSAADLGAAHARQLGGPIRRLFYAYFARYFHSP